MPLVFKKPNKKEFEKSKSLGDAIKKTEKTPADTKALARAQKDLESATLELGRAMEVSFAACDRMSMVAPDVCKTEKPPKVPVPYPKLKGLEKSATKAQAGTDKALKKLEKAQKKFEKVADKELKILAQHLKVSKDKDAVQAHQGIVSAKTMSKAYFQAWSDNVKMEGKNTVRFLDLTKGNQ